MFVFLEELPCGFFGVFTCHDVPTGRYTCMQERMVKTLDFNAVTSARLDTSTGPMAQGKA